MFASLFGHFTSIFILFNNVWLLVVNFFLYVKNNFNYFIFFQSFLFFVMPKISALNSFHANRHM